MSWPLTAVLAPEVSGALDGGHRRDHRRPVRDLLTDVPELLGAALVVRTVLLPIGRALRITI